MKLSLLCGRQVWQIPLACSSGIWDPCWASGSCSGMLLGLKAVGTSEQGQEEGEQVRMLSVEAAVSVQVLAGREEARCWGAV